MKLIKSTRDSSIGRVLFAKYLAYREVIGSNLLDSLRVKPFYFGGLVDPFRLIYLDFPMDVVATQCS